MKASPDTTIFDELESHFLRTDNLLDVLVSGPTEVRCAELEDNLLDTGNLLSKANQLYPNPKYFALIKRQLKAQLKRTHELRDRITQWNSH